MKKFDVVVIGSGSGMIVASNAVESGLKVALVEKASVLGGTCLNWGCIPSKMLIYPADVVAMIQEAEKIGVKARIESIDFKKIMHRMRHLVTEENQGMAKGVEMDPNITWFRGVGEFVKDYTMKVGDEEIKGDKIFIVSGARPFVPPIKGIDGVEYLDNESVLQLEKLPESIIIVGGGYIGCEYAHFFASMGSEVTIVELGSRLVAAEEPEISDLLKKEMEKRMTVYTKHGVEEVKEKDGFKTVLVKDMDGGNVKELSAEALMMAVGRKPNSDLLKPEKTGVEVDKRGFIKVNEYLETSKKNIWAFGDAIGQQMFRHAANYEAQVVWHNAFGGHKVPVDLSATPHAVFTHPQIAGVGLGEDEAKQQYNDVLVGYYYYKDTAKGSAMGDPEGFVKVVVEAESGRLLGGHIIGPFAAILVQELVNAMSYGNRTYAPIVRAMHIHPAITETVKWAFGNLRPVEK
ncbi:MAG: dihydrolipoyl dehydrogenase [Candidatus Jordarchaeum sp.]|uniref:dihydrolipoyl dehydrogenase n=1 Tax=Candidatus Jordarchaeum sp. TaxID=2823881 RepID=UPI004049535E